MTAPDQITRLVAGIGTTRVGARLLRAVAPPLDRLVAGATGGRHAVTELLLPTLLLTTTGRRSGQPRTAPLVYVQHGDALAVAATNWGQKQHPAWSSNLLADPRATAVVDGDAIEVVARPATPHEREVLWPRFDAVYAGFAAYRRRASGRDIRVFLLEPVDRSTADSSTL